MIYKSIEELIGNTPLVEIPRELHNLKHIDLYAKLEYYNPFGSMKDRIAKGMIAPVLEQLKAEGKTVVESSSGNTAKALSMLCNLHGLKFKAITNRIKYAEVRQILQVLDVDLEELPGLSDCADPHDPNDSIQYSRNLVTSDPEKYHLTDQYFSDLNAQSHEDSTAKELLSDLGSVDYLFSFLGTCGSSLGTSRGLKKANENHQVFGIVSQPGHSIPGGRNMNELWEVGLFSRDVYADILAGTVGDAVEGMLTLSRKAGILCGPTSGLVYVKALEKLRVIDAELAASGERKNAVFLVGDRMEPYLGFLQKHMPELFDAQTKRGMTLAHIDEQAISSASEIAPEECVQQIEKNESLVIDIRGNFAYSLGHIPGSINIQDELFGQILESGKIFSRDKKVIVACRIGDISKRYAAYMTKQGQEAYSLEGGVQAYKRAALPLEKAQTL